MLGARDNRSAGLKGVIYLATTGVCVCVCECTESGLKGDGLTNQLEFGISELLIHERQLGRLTEMI